MLPGLVGNIHQLERPEIPGEPASFKVDGDLWGPGRAPPKPDVPSPSHDEGKAYKRPASEGEAQENEPPGQGESPQDQPPSEPDQEEITEIVISEKDEVTIQEPQDSSTPRSEWVQSQKRHLEDRNPHPSPSRKQATREEKSTPRWEMALPTGVKAEDLLPKRYETFTIDHDWVQRVRGSLLGLETGAMPSKKDINTSECFVP